MRATLTEEDQAIRATGAGSSEIGAIVGVSPYQGEYGVWLHKTGRSTIELTDRMLVGQCIEPGITEAYRIIVGAVSVEKPPTMRHPTLPYVVDSCDGIAVFADGSKRCVEVKSTSLRGLKRWGEPGTSQIPDEYALQCQWHMGVHDLDICDVPVWAGDMLRIYHIHRDRELFLILAEAARNFFEKYVLTDIPPPMDGTMHTHQYVSRIRQDSDDTIPASEDVAHSMREYARLAASIKASEEEQRRHEAIIKEAIGSRAEAIGGGMRATWRECVRKGSVDAAKLAELTRATPEQILEATRKPTQYRRFSVEEFDA